MGVRDQEKGWGGGGTGIPRGGECNQNESAIGIS